MIIEKKQPIGGLNVDDAERLLGQTDYLNMENCRIGGSERGRAGRVENLRGTTMIWDPGYTLANNSTIGRTKDTSRRRMLFINLDSGIKTAIFAHDIPTGLTYKVLDDTQLSGGFNFSSDYRVDGNFRVIGDLLFWTDNKSEMRCINIEAGIKLNNPSYSTTTTAYINPLNYTTTTLIKRPGIYPLTFLKQTDTGFANNFIKNNAFQLTYQYVYRDYQTSALASYSDLVPFNTNIDTFNNILIQLPFAETIEQDVIMVNICLKFGNTGKTFIIRTFDKNISGDAAKIVAHNAGTTQLSYTFYGNVRGIALDDISANTSFDNIPLLTKTFEIAKNRLYLGNNLFGYTSPGVTSLAASTSVQTTGTVLHTTWKSIGYQTYDIDPRDGTESNFATGTFYYIDLSPNPILPRGYVFTIPLAGAVDATTALASSGVNVDGTVDIWTLLWAFFNPPLNSAVQFDPSNDTPFDTGVGVAVSLSGVQTTNAFKVGSQHNISITFYDRYRRKCGIVTNDNCIVNIPERTYSTSTFINTIVWTLNNTNSSAEIPDWAYYYQIGITRDLTASFFVEGVSNLNFYIDKNTDGTFTYTATTYASTRYGIAIDISTLISAGKGYTFTEGDLIKIYTSTGSVFDLQVIGVDANWVQCSLKDIGAAPPAVIFSLYTPYIQQQNEPYYEVGNVYPVKNPTSNTRTYSTTTDFIHGDVYFVSVGNFQAMSPNDVTWKDWERNLGWINYTDSIGQKQLTSNIVFSDVFLPGTKVNGFSKFQPTNSQDTFLENGPIQKLILANKQQEEDGSVMLAVCEEGPISIYLGETQLLSNTGNAFVAQAVGIIGTLNALKGNFGTLNPESVYEYLGEAVWYDVINGAFVRYANDGVTPISDYKLNRYFQRYSRKYLQDGAATVKMRSGFSYISTCVDPFHKEVLVTLPATEDPGFCGQIPGYSALPSYTTSIDNRYDFYDGKAKTVSFKMKQDRWNGTYEFLPDCMEYFGEELYAWKAGKLYKHNSSASYNTFYGVQSPPRICVVGNSQPNQIRSLLEIGIEGNMAPTFTNSYCDEPYIQSTDLVQSDYKFKEGIYYARFMKDRLSPNVEGTPEQKMMKGDRIRTATPRIMVEFAVYDKPLHVDFINIGYRISAGHKV